VIDVRPPEDDLFAGVREPTSLGAGPS
jgi:hypothetical protein